MWEKFGACKTIKRAITEFELHCMDFCSLNTSLVVCLTSDLHHVASTYFPEQPFLLLSMLTIDTTSWGHTCQGYGQVCQGYAKAPRGIESGKESLFALRWEEDEEDYYVGGGG